MCEAAGRVVCSAVEPQREVWVATPLEGASVCFGTVLTEDAIAEAREAVASGKLDSTARPGEVRLGTVAHYARRDNLTSATVHGEAVRAICGHWFVPTTDHEHVPRCATCQEMWDRLPAS